MTPRKKNCPGMSGGSDAGGGDGGFGYLNFNRVRYAKPMRYESLEADDEEEEEEDITAGCANERDTVMYG